MTDRLNGLRNLPPLGHSYQHERKEVQAVDFMQRAQPEVVRMEIAERIREAERYSRAKEARQAAKPSAAARRERRFFLFRLVPSRASEA